MTGQNAAVVPLLISMKGGIMVPGNVGSYLLRAPHFLLAVCMGLQVGCVGIRK